MSESGWLTPEAFTAACAALPLVSVDLFVVRPAGPGSELLLGLRNNSPAQGWWFTPGGRARKNEPLGRTLERVAADEIGLAPGPAENARLIGAWDHFYPDSAFAGTVSTHYVNLAYLLQVSRAVGDSLELATEPGSQHSAWKWVPLREVSKSAEVHDNVKMVVPRVLESTLHGGVAG